MLQTRIAQQDIKRLKGMNSLRAYRETCYNIHRLAQTYLVV
jgi:hypothetical protein